MTAVEVSPPTHDGHTKPEAPHRTNRWLVAAIAVLVVTFTGFAVWLWVDRNSAISEAEASLTEAEVLLAQTEALLAEVESSLAETEYLSRQSENQIAFLNTERRVLNARAERLEEELAEFDSMMVGMFEATLTMPQPDGIGLDSSQAACVGQAMVDSEGASEIMSMLLATVGPDPESATLEVLPMVFNALVACDIPMSDLGS